ncbi:MAG: response regulator transcription factor [Paludibacter sp.]
MKRILLVEDDVNLGTTLAGALETLDYEVCYLIHGEGVMDKYHDFKPDLVILDIMLNSVLDGFEIARLIRLENDLPILFTTSRDGNEDFRVGLSIENSDYVRKPYKLMEVTMRLAKLLSLNEKTAKRTEIISIGHFRFIPEEQSLVYEFDKIHLNNYESAVLALLSKSINEYLSREDIIKSVWNVKDPKIKDGSLNNVLTRLRKYMNQDNNVNLESKIGLGVKITIQK